MDQRLQVITEFAASRAAHQSDANDPDVLENVAKARRQHRKRFWTQVVFWGAVLLASSVVFPLMQHLVVKAPRSSCDAGLLNLSCFLSPEYPVLGVVAGVTLLAWLYHHFWYLRERKHEWKTAVSDAQAMISADKTAEGNTDLFRIYVQTKRRSYWLITLALGGAIAASAYGATLAQKDLSIVATQNPFGLPLVLLIGCSCIGLLRSAYLIGSSFAPGEVIVRHIIALAVLAVSNITDIDEVRRQVEVRTREFVKRSPWWFYTSG